MENKWTEGWGCAQLSTGAHNCQQLSGVHLPRGKSTSTEEIGKKNKKKAVAAEEWRHKQQQQKHGRRNGNGWSSANYARRHVSLNIQRVWLNLLISHHKTTRKAAAGCMERTSGRVMALVLDVHDDVDVWLYIHHRKHTDTHWITNHGFGDTL